MQSSGWPPHSVQYLSTVLGALTGIVVVHRAIGSGLSQEKVKGRDLYPLAVVFCQTDEEQAFEVPQVLP